MGISRADVVQSFLSLYQEPRYLEVGVEKGLTFHALSAARKVAVDPHFQFDVSEAESAHPEATYHQVPSDEYFGSRARGQFEVIYLDGLHTFEQILRDFTNALELITPDGVIVIDDVIPNSYFASMSNASEFWALHAGGFVQRAFWMGDVYRLVFFIDTFFQQVSFRTVEENHGQLVVWKNVRESVPERTVEEVARLPYERVLSERAVFRPAPVADIVDEVASWKAAAAAAPLPKAPGSSGFLGRRLGFRSPQ
jgi:hypothetical protein